MNLYELKVLIKGGGELATGIAHRLHSSNFRVCLTETAHPEAVRREIAFSEAVHDGEKTVEGVTARLIASPAEMANVWCEGKMPLIIDPEAKVVRDLKPDVVVDAIIAKRNLGTQITDALLVIGVGVGFTAGRDVHVVIETNRGHNLGRLIYQGEAEPNTGIPGIIAGVAAERVFRAPVSGRFATVKMIGDSVEKGEVVATVDGSPVEALVGGIIRGLLRDGTVVRQGMKAGDIDPRGITEYCYTISDKARAIAGAVLAAIMAHFNR